MSLADGVSADVTFEKKAADESYGNETCSVTIHLPIPEGTTEHGPPEVLIASALATARRLVHEELRNSSSLRVVRSVEPVGRRVPVTTDDVADLEDLPF